MDFQILASLPLSQLIVGPNLNLLFGHNQEYILLTQRMQLLGSKRIRTTACHPIANSFIEQLHCQLKLALKFHTNSTHRVESLLLVLLGIRTALKEDIQYTSAELLYGTNMCLPVEFFYLNKDTTPADPAAEFKIYLQN